VTSALMIRCTTPTGKKKPNYETLELKVSGRFPVPDEQETETRPSAH